MPRYKFLTDPIFRGISKIWSIKTHFQDNFHEYLVLSSDYSTFILHLEDYVMTDVTNVMNVEKNIVTLIAFNLKNSGFFYHVSAEKIIVGDISKIDSPDCQFVKYEYMNPKSLWDLAFVHDFNLFCLSRSFNRISVFQLKGRPRDIDFIISIADIDIQIFGSNIGEISAFAAQKSATGFCMYLASVSGYLYFYSLDHSFQLLSEKSVYLGNIIETIILSKDDASLEIYAGTRNGGLLLINFKESPTFQIDQLSSAPLKLSKFSNETLMAYNFDSFLLINENSDKCTKRKILNWESESATEFICRTGENYIVGIKEDSLFLMAMPLPSENVLSRRPLFHSTKISAFLLLKSELWILGCSNVNDRKKYLKLFDRMGLEIASIEEGTDNILSILSVDTTRDIILVVLIAKDYSQSKFQLFDIGASKFEAISEYNCEGAVSNVKISDRYGEGEV